MNGNDLLKGMNHIEDEMLQEAAKHTKKKRNLLPAAMAAVVAVAAGLSGAVIWNQQKQISQMEKELNLQISEVQEAADQCESVGVISGSQIGSRYQAAGSYKELYQLILNQFGSPTAERGWGATWAETLAGVPEDIKEEAAVEDEMNSTSGSATAVDTADTPASDGEGGYSSTNTMTEKVDESDIIKTDGKYIYVVHSGTIEITDIRQGIPGETIRVAPEFASPSDQISEIFVEGGYLTILGNHYEMNYEKQSDSYGYGNGRDQTFVYVYDIQKPLSPEFVGSTIQDGSFNTARKIGDQVYLFTDYYLERMTYSEKEAFEDENLKKWVPTINGKPVAADCIYLPDSGYHGLVISSFQVSDPKSIQDAKVIVDDYSEIYVSNTSIYLYSETYQANRPLTEIAKVEFHDGLLETGEVTSVTGTIRDNFAINEKDGYLRVLTTNWDTEENTLFVLDSDLKLTGRIDGIARGEQIYAARFIGNLGYFITYRNMDPLFAVDLSDPHNPEILGELEISGFSEYLHSWDDNHLLGIGYEAKDNQITGMKFVMFDISDPVNLKTEDTYVIDGIQYSSALSGNYKEILADPDKNLIGTAGTHYDSDHSEYYVMTYDKEKGFQMLHSEELESWDGSQYRGLYSGDYFYLVGYGKIRTYKISEGFQAYEQNNK